MRCATSASSASTPAAYDVVILNFANCDMVGHTGVLEAAVKAVETVDTCVGRVVEATLKMGGDRHDHRRPRQRRGDAPARRQSHDRPHHQPRALYPLRSWHGAAERGRLADIAPTILDVMGLACPPEMDGKSLIVR